MADNGADFILIFLDLCLVSRSLTFFTELLLERRVLCLEPGYGLLVVVGGGNIVAGLVVDIGIIVFSFVEGGLLFGDELSCLDDIVVDFWYHVN